MPVDDLKAFNAAVLLLRNKWRNVQRRLHQHIAENPEGVFDVNNLSLNLPTFRQVAVLIKEEGIDEEYVEHEMALFPAALNYVRTRSTRFTEDHKTIIEGMNILAGVLVANGDLYRALRFMIDAIKLGETSPKISLLALTLAIELEELEFYAEIRNLISMKQVTGMFSSWLQALDLNSKSRLSSSPSEINEICSQVYSALARLSQDESKAVAKYCTEIALRRVLIHASKQPNANIHQIGDPIYHIHRCYDLAQGILCGFFPELANSNSEMKMFGDDRASLLFEKCFYFHEYCHNVKQLIYELFDCGIVTDAERRFAANFKFALISCIPYRLLSVVNSFYFIQRQLDLLKKKLTDTEELIQVLLSIDYGWILQQEQVYARALLSGFSRTADYDALFKLKAPVFVSQFGRNKVATLLQTSKEDDALLPLFLAENMIRSAVKFASFNSDKLTAIQGKYISNVLDLCKRVETICRSSWLMLRHMNRPQLPAPLYSWIQAPLTKHERTAEKPKSTRQKKIPTDKEPNPAILDAYKEYKRFQHLFYINWRQECATYIAANVEQALNGPRPYHLAMLLSESMSISLKASTRILETEKIQPKRLEFELTKIAKTSQLNKAFEALTIDDNKKKSEKIGTADDELPTFPTGFFGGSEVFMNFVSEFPADITVLQFTLDSNDILWFTRFHRAHQPYSIPLCKIADENSNNQKQAGESPLLIQFKRILEDNDSTTKVKDAVPKDFWTKRRALNAEMEALVKEMQERFLGKLWPLCQPFGPNATNCQKAREVQLKIQSVGFCQASSIILTHLLDYVSDESWTELLKLMAERESLDVKNFGKLNYVPLRTMMSGSGRKKARHAGEAYTFLVLPPLLSVVPWQCMPVFQEALISRIPSISILKALLVKHEKIPKQIDARRSYYVLNPSGDLVGTQNRLGDFVSKMQWQGVIGQAPAKEDVMKALVSQDMYVFLGHGNGRKYIGTSRDFKDLDCRSVCLLIGCSSVQIELEGRNYDGRSIVYDFMLSHCPCLVGCLWMITDMEADRFFMELIRLCSEELKSEAGRKGSSSANTTRPGEVCRSIIRGISRARRVCKLPYLTGSAFVAYGLPTLTQF